MVDPGSRVCSKCGTSATGATGEGRFCGKCGGELVAAMPRAAQPMDAKRTMLGVSPFAPPAPQASPPARPSFGTATGVAGLVSPVAAAPEALGAAVRPTPDVKKTMLGVPAGMGLSLPTATAAPSPGHATMVATPSAVGASVLQPPRPIEPPQAMQPPRPIEPPQAMQPMSARPPTEAAPRPPGIDPQSKRTMLGAAPPSLVASAAGTVPPSHRTMLGNAPPVSASAAPARESEPLSWATDELPVTRSSGLIVAIIVVFILLGGAVGAWFFLRSPSDTVAASLVDTAAGTVLRLALPNAPSGAIVKYAGAESSVASGHADLAIHADGLRLGPNEIAFELTSPGKPVEKMRVVLNVDFRIHPDLAGMAALDPPGVDLVVEALPDAKIKLGGRAVTLDAQGRGRHRVNAPFLPDRATWDLAIPYHVQIGDRAPVQGQSVNRLPLASFTLDRPGVDSVTDRAQAVFAGSVQAGSTVHIHGTPVSVAHGKFRLSVPIPELRTYEMRVVVRQPNRVANMQTVRVRRVADLGAEARAFETDPSVTYAVLAREPTAQRGKQVLFEGRAYNVQVSGGNSTVQVLVRDCPRGERCPLWVNYAGAVEIGVDSNVRIVGVVAGEQQFRSQKTNRVITVPRVDAKYILPASGR